MSWLFSQALVEEYSLENCSDGILSVQLSVMPTQHKFWRNDKTMEFSRLSQFGLTCQVLTENRGQDVLTWYREVFLARTSPSPEKAVDWTAKGLGYGEKWLGLLAKYSQDSRSLKTAQCSFLEDSMSSSVILPASGLMLDGECYLLPPLERLTSENASGLLPTPTTQDNVQIQGQYATNGTTLAGWVKLWTTPSASDGTRGGTITDNMSGTSLSQQVNTPKYWPTPVAQEAKVNQKPRTEGTKGTQTSLSIAVLTWPTPTARIWKGGGGAMTRKDGKSRSDMLDWAVEYQTGGRLNPQWVEWLMGWPVGWTDLKPLATDKSPCVQLTHSEHCTEVSK
jgi:hypothetical protein